MKTKKVLALLGHAELWQNFDSEEEAVEQAKLDGIEEISIADDGGLEEYLKAIYTNICIDDIETDMDESTEITYGETDSFSDEELVELEKKVNEAATKVLRQHIRKHHSHRTISLNQRFVKINGK